MYIYTIHNHVKTAKMQLPITNLLYVKQHLPQKHTVKHNIFCPLHIHAKQFWQPFIHAAPIFIHIINPNITYKYLPPP